MEENQTENKEEQKEKPEELETVKVHERRETVHYFQPVCPGCKHSFVIQFEREKRAFVEIAHGGAIILTCGNKECGKKFRVKQENRRKK